MPAPMCGVCRWLQPMGSCIHPTKRDGGWEVFFKGSCRYFEKRIEEKKGGEKMAGYKEASPGTKETLMRDARLILGVIDDMQTTINSLQHEVESMERYADRLDESEAEEDQMTAKEGD